MKKLKKPNEEIDADLYSTSILQELLDSNNQWNGVDDIVKITFKAVTDILNTHAQSLKDLKTVITTRASKTELSTGLSLKCNISDISKTVEELSRAIEQKSSYRQINTILKDYASMADLNQVLAEREVIKQSKQNDQKEYLEVAILKARMDQFQKQITKRVSGCVALNQFQQLMNIVQNKANVSEVNQALDNKISKQYLTTALQKKISKTDLDSALSKKADTADLDYLVNSLQNKVSLTSLQKLTQVLQNKADKSDLVVLANERSSHSRSQQRQQQQQWTDRLEQVRGAVTALSLQLKQLRRDVNQELRQNQSNLSVIRREFDNELKKISNGSDIQMAKKISKIKLETGEEMESVRTNLKYLQEELTKNNKAMAGLANDLTQHKRGNQNIYAYIDELQKHLAEMDSNLLEKKEFIEFKSQLIQLTENKVQIQDVQTALNKFEIEVNSKMNSQKQQYLQMLKNVQNSSNQNHNSVKRQIMELDRLINKKQQKSDNSKVQQNLRSFRKVVDDCRKTVDVVYNQINRKLGIKQYQTDLIQLRRRFELMAKEVAVKANIKDVCVLSDSKPNIDDVNNALKEINDALSDKITEADLQNILKDQATINETLCTQNIVGRWMWKSGELKPGGLIPWESELANTVPDHFFWEKDKSSILIISTGIYEITACVFSKNSVLTILANGQVVNLNKLQDYQNKQNKKMTKKKKQKQIGSNSVIEYLMLPSRSRLSVSCSGDVAQGFLNIRRL